MTTKLYHAIVAPRSSSDVPAAIYDMDLGALKARIVDPYDNGLALTVSGTSFEPANIKRVRVFRSDQDFKTLLTEAQRSDAEAYVAVIAPNYEYLEDVTEECTDEFILGPPGHRAKAVPDGKTAHHGGSPGNVFVIHGRNKKVRDSVFSFLRAIGLKPLEWEEIVALTAKATPYIFEVITTGFEHAHAVVAVFSPDDDVVLRSEFQTENDPEHERRPWGQARPNVIFEAGMAKALNPERTLIVEVGQCKPFTDVSGMHTVRLSNSATQRKAFAQRLETAGCSVNISGMDWLDVGDFSVDSAPPTSMPSGSAKRDLVFANGLKWERIGEGGQVRYRPYCPDCEVPLTKTVDFIKCPKCGFEDLMPQPPRD